MQARRALLGFETLIVAAALVAGCGGSGSSSSSRKPEGSPAGDIPDTQAYISYMAPSGQYTVKVPEGWARTDTPTGATFTDNRNTIRIEATPSATAPDASSVQTVESPALRAVTPGFQLQGVTTASRPAGTAVVVRYLDDGPVDAVTGRPTRQAVQRYEFWRNGVRVALTLVSPVGADNADPWRRVTDSFAWNG